MDNFKRTLSILVCCAAICATGCTQAIQLVDSENAKNESVIKTEILTSVKPIEVQGDVVQLELPIALETYRSELEKSVQPYIRISAENGKTLPWESKFGGNPYFPLNSNYPKDVKGKPMRLLAQINFEEVPGIDLFPSKGILQFFISANDDLLGMNFDKPTDQENFKVIYIEDVEKDESKILKDFSFIRVSEDDYFPITTECKLKFSKAYAPVGTEDYRFQKIFGTYAYELFDQVSDNPDELYEQYQGMGSSTGHKMAGYSFFTQEDPRIYDNKDYEVMLLQIDSDDELNIMWGDAGVANFFIRSEDLKRMDFSKVYYNWDCY